MNVAPEPEPRKVVRADAFPASGVALAPHEADTGFGEALKSFGCSFFLGLALIVVFLPAVSHSHCCGETRSSKLRRDEIRSEITRAIERDGG